MKKLLLSILLILSFGFGKAQYTQKYPFFYIKNGDTLGIVISIAQAQKIDNDYDIMAILKESKIAYDKMDSAYISVVKQSGEEIATLKLKIDKLNDIITTSDKQIQNLKEQIKSYEADKELSSKQILKLEQVISNNDKTISKLKTQRLLGFTVGGGSLLGVIFLLLVKK